MSISNASYPALCAVTLLPFQEIVHVDPCGFCEDTTTRDGKFLVYMKPKLSRYLSVFLD